MNIKLKVWDRKTETWIYAPTKMSYLYRVFQELEDPSGQVDLDPITVCVATGKTDKDGDEIYEGDILEVTGTHFTKGNRYEVIWAACAFRLMPERHRHSAKVCYQVLDVWPGDTTFAYKRIGNIHDEVKA